MDRPAGESRDLFLAQFRPGNNGKESTKKSPGRSRGTFRPRFWRAQLTLGLAPLSLTTLLAALVLAALLSAALTARILLLLTGFRLAALLAALLLPALVLIGITHKKFLLACGKIPHTDNE
jgi:hypothetical protein